MRSVFHASRTLAVVALTLCGFGCSSPWQRAYNSPEAAANALITAAQSGEQKELQAVLGPESSSIISSGDSVADQNERKAFIAAFHQQHNIVLDGYGEATLLVGKDQWPFPVPIVFAGGGWTMDTARGIVEIIHRRIGRNELSTIQVCLATVEAQNDYRLADPEGNGAYATKFFSDPGKKNGLYWPPEADQPPSPLGELVAAASSEGYSDLKSGKHQPYHGYYYRILTEQGPAAVGGARSYLVDGKLTDGYAILAWPAEYGKSGIVTFIVNRYGIVYEQDLGEATAERVKALNAFDPTPEWNISED